MNTIRALIVGAGIVGERHLKAQIQCGSHTGVYDHLKDKVLRIKNKYSNTHGFHNLDEALEWCTLVHICTPDDLHVAIAKEAIIKNCAVLCEKPLTTNMRDSKILVDLVKQNNTTFIVGNNNRLTPVFMEIKKRLVNKKIGTLISIRATYLHDMRKLIRQTPWRKHQNFLWGGGIHAIDLVLWMIDEKIEDAVAIAGRKTIKNMASDQDYQILLKFQSGLVAQLWVNARVTIPVHKVDLEVYGEKGALIANNKSRYLKSHMDSQSHSKTKKDYLSESISLGYRFTLNREVEIVNNFITGVSKSHYPLPDIYESYRTIEVVHNVLKSLRK